MRTELKGSGLVGTVLDEAYWLNRLICEGGMGTVFEGVHMRLRKRIAVKVMAPELAENQEALARFRREVEVTAQLGHPNVISLLDFGTTPTGEPYLVMEYLDGEDLEQRLKRVGRLPLSTTIAILRQIASALTLIHAKGIVHRDLKPANIFLLPREGCDDLVKVVDFGISKVQSAKTKLTHSFAMMGTPECMAPEQAAARADDVDARTDQWAFACVVWKMLSGQLPFEAQSLNELLHKIQHDEPPALKSVVPGLPRDVEKVLRRALSKRQDDRFPSIAAFVQAFEQATASRSPGARVITPEAKAPTRRGAPTLLLAMVTLIAMAVGGTLVYRANEPAVRRMLDEIVEHR
jgi:eukaryotic-like serine/threonine-protein kinase